MPRSKATKTIDAAMSEPNTSATTPAKGGIKFSRKTVKLHVGQSEEQFVVHEDLICENSSVFRGIFQAKRQAYKDVPEEESECPICTEQLEPGVKELTYCPSSCGKNFHYNCIKPWVVQSGEPEDFLCPYCRQPWLWGDDTDNEHTLSEINAQGFTVYYTWLYHNCISVQEDNSGIPSLNILFEAAILGETVRDTEFCKAVLAYILEVVNQIHYISGSEMSYFPGLYILKNVYGKTTESSPIRRVLLFFYNISGRQLWNDVDEVPEAFWKDVRSY
jgi:hypothetical protein